MKKLILAVGLSVGAMQAGAVERGGRSSGLERMEAVQAIAMEAHKNVGRRHKANDGTGCTVESRSVQGELQMMYVDQRVVRDQARRKSESSSRTYAVMSAAMSLAGGSGLIVELAAAQRGMEADGSAFSSAQKRLEAMASILVKAGLGKPEKTPGDIKLDARLYSGDNNEDIKIVNCPVIGGY